MNFISHLLAQKNKYIVVALVLAFAWQSASVLTNLSQLLLSKPSGPQVLFVAPKYTELLAGESTWSWSNHKELYAKIPTNSVPTISLKVTLLGIMSSGDNGFAIMKINNAKEKIYKKGTIVSGNTKLKKVDIDSITLSDGNTERVYTIHNQRPNVFLQSLAPTKSLIAAPEKAISTKKRISVGSLPKDKRTKIAKFEQRIKDNPLAASNDIDVDPVSKNGKVYGYRVNYRIDPALLLSIGLLPTDIVISVNDIPASTIASDSSIATKLWGESSYLIIYERNGVKNTLNLKR